MSTSLVAFAVALLVSTAALAYLGLRDPKRLGLKAEAARHLRTMRIACVICCLAPGGWLLFEGGGYFLMWFGYVAVIGWIVALALQKRETGAR